MANFVTRDFQKIGKTENLPLDWKSSGVSIDSRNIPAGTVFFALQGEKADGHDFVKEALAKGASACVVRESWFASHAAELIGKSLVIVPDTLKALQALARNYRTKFDPSVIAITGSNGKTTCKEMTHAVLSKLFITMATKGNLNNEIGVPLTLFNITAETQVAIVEMGANRKNDIALLCDIAKPDSGVITNIGTAHIGGFGSIENIAATKAELFEALAADGVRFVNVDDDRLRPHAAQKKGLVTFGILNDADFRGSIVAVDDRARVKLRVDTPEKNRLEFQLKIPGVHHASNALIACAVGVSLGVPSDDVVEALVNYQPMYNRMGTLEKNGVLIINDTYNASPESMFAALECLSTTKGSRKVAVLGDMLELGEESPALHETVGQYAAKKKLDALFVFGAESKKILEGAKGVATLQHFDSKNMLIEELRNYVKPGDVLLIKGSRGMKMEEVVEGLIK